MKLGELLESTINQYEVPHDIPLVYHVPFLIGYKACLEDMCKIVKQHQEDSNGEN